MDNDLPKTLSKGIRNSVAEVPEKVRKKHQAIALAARGLTGSAGANGVCRIKWKIGRAHV